MFAKTSLFLTGLALFASSGLAQTGRLFVGENGFDPDNPPTCYETNLDSGFPGSVSWTPTFNLAIQGAACSPQNVMYFTTGTFQTDLYVTIPGREPSRACTTSVAIFDMGYVNGKLYGWAQYASPSGIYEINPETGQCTLAVASTSELFFALDGNPADGLLYGYSEYGASGLYSINPSTGEKHRISTGPVGHFPEAYGMYRGLAVGNNTVYLTSVWNGRELDDPDHVTSDTFYSYDLSQGDNGTFVQFANPYANTTPQLGGAFWYDPSVVAQPPYPANDLPANATHIGEGTFDFNTTWAETEGDSTCAFGGTFADVWFLYTPTYSHFAEFTTVNNQTQFDTLMSIYTPDGSTELACNDDTGGFSLGSTIGYQVTAGQPVLIRIAGWDYGWPAGIQRGPGQLTIRECAGLSITRQPEGGNITRCMQTAPQDGSQGPFYIIVAAEIAQHAGSFQFAWERDGVPVTTNFSGSLDEHGVLIQTSGTFSRVLLIRPNQSDVGNYRCVITSSDACGDQQLSVTTQVATVTACLADFSCDGFVDGFDYDDFVTAFEAGNGLEADFNGDGFVDGFDYDDFVTAFETGC